MSTPADDGGEPVPHDSSVGARVYRRRSLLRQRDEARAEVDSLRAEVERLTDGMRSLADENVGLMNRAKGYADERDNLRRTLTEKAKAWIAIRERAIENRYDTPAHHWRGQDGDELLALLAADLVSLADVRDATAKPLETDSFVVAADAASSPYTGDWHGVEAREEAEKKRELRDPAVVVASHLAEEKSE